MGAIKAAQIYDNLTKLKQNTQNRKKPFSQSLIFLNLY